MTQLNVLQQNAYDNILNKKNVFITGSGGVGKSYLIKAVFQKLSKTKKIAMTSMTGVSANLIGGQTIHSYLGIGLGKQSFDLLYKKISASKFLLRKWVSIEILILDEISMLTLELFEKLEKLARHLRNSQLPFGGMQLIFSGDFLQISPIETNNFCFESTLWNKCINETIYLKEIIRQKDQLFISILNKIRIGCIDDEVKEVIKSREVKYLSETGLIPTMLYSTNVKVDNTNKRYYDKLEEKEYNYEIKYAWKQNVYDRLRYENLVKFHTKLELKIGCQVMFLINKDNLFNGSRGVIKEFIGGYPVVLFADNTKRIITYETLSIEENDIEIMSYSQLPLRLSWAITCSKSVGMSCDLLRVDFKNIFAYGMAYVALSRVRKLENLYIRNLDFNLIYTNPKAKKFYEDLSIK